jgi:hypothetical protein
MHGGNLGEGADAKELAGLPTVDETFRLKLQHRLVLELLVDSITGSKTDTYGKSFWPTHTGSYKHSSMQSSRSSARSYGTHSLRGTRSRLALRRKALRGFSWHV